MRLEHKTQMTPQQVRDTLQQYNSLIAQKKQIEVNIKALKQTIENGCFGEQTPNMEGTETSHVEGCIVKRVCKLTRTLTKDEAELQQALQLISERSRDRIVTFAPKLSLAEYKLLDPNDKAVIDGIMTVKLASPTITVEGDFN